MKENKYYEHGYEKYSKLSAISENILIIANVGFGFLGMLPLTFLHVPLISIIYICFITLMLGFVLRKHLCTHCYYYDKWCHCGWGKLSSAMYKKDSGNLKLGNILGGVTWGILMALPIITMIIIIFSNIAELWFVLKFLVPFIVLSAINLFFHKQDCSYCKMRYICKLSAAK